jgi:hypothetical protein
VAWRLFRNLLSLVEGIGLLFLGFGCFWPVLALALHFLSALSVLVLSLTP